MSWTALVITVGCVWACVAGVDVGCHTGADCADRTCCQQLDAALWVQRRKLADIDDDIKKFPGICVPMGNTEWDCYQHVDYAYEKPMDLVEMCPCRTGLICADTGFTDKYGKQGICTWG